MRDVAPKRIFKSDIFPYLSRALSTAPHPPGKRIIANQVSGEKRGMGDVGSGEGKKGEAPLLRMTGARALRVYKGRLPTLPLSQYHRRGGV